MIPINNGQLLTFTDRGIYCPTAEVYIDPWKPVDRAIITHGHSDHARAGMTRYMAHRLTAAIMRYRISPDIQAQEVEYGEVVTINGVSISLHPAGHIPGSSQVRIEYQGEVWVVSGDYKLEDDGLSTSFEAVPCHTFITECTFGLPIFKWQNQESISNDLGHWIDQNEKNSVTSVIYAYSLGKAQRIAQMLIGRELPIVMHGATRAITSTLIEAGLPLKAGISPEDFKRIYPEMTPIVLAPLSAQNSPWIGKFRPYALANASGWMTIQGIKRRSGVDRGFTLSDHADFLGLLSAIKATGAQRIFSTHGYTSQFARYLQELGYESAEVSTNFGEAFEQSEAL